MWLQGRWSDRWPKMDAFLNVTQVFLYLSSPLSLSVSFAFEDDMPVGFISSPILLHSVYLWCQAEGKSFSHSWLCGLVSYTARWQASISGSVWVLAEWCFPPDLWSDGAKDRSISAWYLENTPTLPHRLPGEGTLVLFGFLERFPVGLTDELISKVLPFRFNPVDHWALMDQFYMPPFCCAHFQHLSSQMSHWLCRLPDAFAQIHINMWEGRTGTLVWGMHKIPSCTIKNSPVSSGP